MLRKRTHQTVHTLHRSVGKQNRLSGQQTESERLHAAYPPVDAYISRGLPSMKMKMEIKIRNWLQSHSVPETGFLQYKFYDKKGEEIDLQEEEIEKISI